MNRAHAALEKEDYMTVRATEAVEDTLIKDLLAIRDAKRVVCHMTHEEIMRCMQLGLHDDERSEYYEVDYNEVLEEDACYAHLPLSIRPCDDGAELVPKDEGISGLQLRIETESFRHKSYEAAVDACYWHDGVEAVFSTDEDEELAASSEVAAAILVSRSESHTLPVIQGIAERILEALF